MTRKHHSRRFSIRAVALRPLLVLCTAFPVVALADTTSQSLDFTFNQQTPPGALLLNFNAFDASLGNLLGVEVSIGATRRHDWALWKNAPPPGLVHISSALLAGTALNLDGTAFDFANVEYGPINTQALAVVPDTVSGPESDAGTAQFLHGLDPVFPDAYQNGSLTNLSGALLPLTFSGLLNISFDPGTMDVNYDEGSFEISANNFDSLSLVEVTGKVTVTYVYQVADSRLGWSSPLALGALVLFARRREWSMGRAA